MTPTAPRRAATAALLILAGALMGCDGPAEPASPAHSTWAIPADTASPSATPTVSPTQTATAESTTDPTTTSTRRLATDPAGPTDAPKPTTEISNPTYDINHIDRADPAQVVWAYLTHRLSRSYTDIVPGAGLTAASQYAAPDLAAQLAEQVAMASSDWPQLRATEGTTIGTLTHLSTYVAGDRATVIAAWTLTVTTKGHEPRATVGLSSTVALTSLPGEAGWRVTADGLALPN